MSMKCYELIDVIFELSNHICAKLWEMFKGLVQICNTNRIDNRFDAACAIRCFHRRRVIKLQPYRLKRCYSVLFNPRLSLVIFFVNKHFLCL